MESSLTRGVAFGGKWPDKRGGLWWEWHYKRRTTILSKYFVLLRNSCGFSNTGGKMPITEVSQYIHI